MEVLIAACSSSAHCSRPALSSRTRGCALPVFVTASAGACWRLLATRGRPRRRGRAVPRGVGPGETLVGAWRARDTAGRGEGTHLGRCGDPSGRERRRSRRRRLAPGRTWPLDHGSPRTCVRVQAGRTRDRPQASLPSRSRSVWSPRPPQRAGPPENRRLATVAALAGDRRRIPLRVRPDVDPPAGQAGREPGVLALLADRERQLVVGHDHARRSGGQVDHLDAADPSRRQRARRRSRPGRRTSRRCRSSRRAARA